MEENRHQQLSRARAKYTLDKVNQFYTTAPNKKEEYKSLAISLPAMILSNGLVLTLAFLQAKGKDEATDPKYDLYRLMQEWLREQGQLPKNNELTDYLTTTTSRQCRQATNEILELLKYHKRWAEAKYKGI